MSNDVKLCEVCSSPVLVHASSEGTCWYEPIPHDEAVRELTMRMDQVRRLVEDRSHWRHLAEQKIYARAELADLLGTEDIGEAVERIKAWKDAAEAAVGGPDAKYEGPCPPWPSVSRAATDS